MGLKTETQVGREKMLELKRRMEDGNKVALQKKGLLQGNQMSDVQFKKK